MNTRGTQRERTLDRSVYYNDRYFAMPQLLSFAHQIHEINKLKPSNILEIGPGNGFTSSFLKRAGYEITTVDINPNLEPDICAPLSELAGHLRGRRFDLVVCCEVLEHMPFEEFKANISYLRNAGERLFLTLPNYARSVGFGGIAKIPKLGAKLFRLVLDINTGKRLEGGPHFWEVGSRGDCSKKAIQRELLAVYREVDAWRFALNPYHVAFYAR